MSKVLSACLLALWFLWVGLWWGYRMGKESGYSQGWSDAHCGVGLDCEAGQE